MIAAAQTGRVCYWMEIDPGYVAVILERFQEATGTKPELLGKENGKTRTKTKTDGS